MLARTLQRNRDFWCLFRTAGRRLARARPPVRCTAVPRPLLAVLPCLILAACAGANVTPPQPPDLSVLSRARAMLAKAAEAGAPELAPDAFTAARQRLTSARYILYHNVEPGALSEAERRRVRQLADAAYLDARLAFVRTQANAVQRKNEQLAGELEGNRGTQPEEGET